MSAAFPVYRWRSFLFLPVACILLFASVLIALRFGSLPVSSSTVFQALFLPDSSPDQIVIRFLRFPRVMLAGFVGAALAVAGALLQGITRNPLGSPELFGVLAGTELGATIAIFVLGIQSLFICTLFAFLSGAFTLALVFVVAQLARSADSFTGVAVAGFSVGIFIGGITDLIIKWRETQFLTLYRWAEGSIGGRDPKITFGVIPFILAGILVALLLSQQLNVLNLGEEAAIGLGVRFRSVRLLGFAAVLVLTAAAVIAAGPISFIGLVVPHLARLFTGPDHRLLLPGSALIGAAVLILGDLCARTFLAGTLDELPITAITAAVGAPAFLLILRKRVING